MQVKRVRCEASGVLVAKDKAIKRFIVRNIVDASAIRDIQDSSILEGKPTPAFATPTCCTACLQLRAEYELQRRCCRPFAIAKRPLLLLPPWSHICKADSG